ncbi:Protein related to penicillin acylase [Archaeoglobus sulfaticallidus PM70-1]|uniref:Protein related to penicillin acylase n=1 Tax=Archaeoglobus sulfaticallidus PM70-1 TaxID=387631 RepID=N0BK43_9EURY|nr:penicillin acylase family protein [Archaeoglobus sulfaticallidus]AGK60495.1 Protein related to penicillin acylase [Archaeoglobus sulfaticallidus PM70-1]
MRKIAGIILLIALLAVVFKMYSYIELFAPLSGKAWVTDELETPYGLAKITRVTDEHINELETPYGLAKITYDEYGVPHIYAKNEKALYYAVGYVQAKDRLFQMDLHRRLMKGTLSEVFGESLVDSDIFHIKLDFYGAAKATWEEINKTPFGDLIEAYCDGVNAYMTSNLPLEFRLLNYRPEPWKPEDVFLIDKEISWELTGNFWDLKRALIAEKLPSALELYPEYLNHTSPIIRTNLVDKELLDWLKPFEKKGDVGSNNWVISGKYTANGKPILANDPHLSLTVPPVWYEMHIKTDEINVRGVTFPGIPVIIIGMNDHVAWGVTNVGADVIDFYYYVTKGDKYLYKGEWKNFEIEEKKMRVKTANGYEERTVLVKKTVHGPVIEKNGKEFAIAWTGFAATNEFYAIYKYNHARNMSDFIEGLKYFDVPAQNLVYIDADGNIMYYPAGKFPIRDTGNIIFNGSAGEGEWKGFKPYGKSTWEGFIPFEEIPHLINPDYVATANQRVVFDYQYYLGDSGYFADPYRGMRIYEMIDDAVKAGKKIDMEYVMKMQRDTYSKPAEFLIKQIKELKPKFSEKAKMYADELMNWDYRMDKNSRQALIFAIWLKHYINETFGDEFYSAGLDSDYYPKLWVLQNLDDNSKWFDDIRTSKVENKADIMARAMDKAVEEIEKNNYRVYGDYNRLKMNHPFNLDFLNYPNLPMNGSEYTVFNFRVNDKPFQVGSSWRMVVSFDKAYCVIPGGNSGNYFSKNYDDQLEMWVNGEYKEMVR